jgi:hypothetical protein
MFERNVSSLCSGSKSKPSKISPITKRQAEPSFSAVYCLAYTSPLKVEAVRSPETSVELTELHYITTQKIVFIKFNVVHSHSLTHTHTRECQSEFAERNTKGGCLGLVSFSD